MMPLLVNLRAMQLLAYFISCTIIHNDFYLIIYNDVLIFTYNLKLKILRHYDVWAYHEKLKKMDNLSWRL